MTKKIYRSEIYEILKLQKRLPGIISQVKEIMESLVDYPFSELKSSSSAGDHCLRTFHLAHNITCSLNHLNDNINYINDIAKDEDEDEDEDEDDDDEDEDEDEDDEDEDEDDE
jgi:phosphopantothenoylcysteine synthetase/decarboxylase